MNTFPFVPAVQLLHGLPFQQPLPGVRPMLALPGDRLALGASLPAELVELANLYREPREP
jgi:hypothetical protein